MDSVLKLDWGKGNLRSPPYDRDESHSNRWQMSRSERYNTDSLDRVFTHNMRGSSDVPRLSVFLAAKEQSIANLRLVNKVAINPCRGRLRALLQIRIRAFPCCDHPVLDLPCLRLLVLPVLLVLVVCIVCATGKRTKTECEAASEL